MNENINLCELLKGHEGETFYSPLTQGNITLVKVDELLVFREHTIALNDKGAFYPNGECMLFPSKDQRDWNKWAENKKPKTWSDISKTDRVKSMGVTIIGYNDKEMRDKNGETLILNHTPIEKSALILLKIYQLIEVGYGSNVTNKEWQNIDIDKYTIECSPSDPNDIFYIELADYFNHIAFHTREQAEEFMSYPENVQLLKDFYMI